MTPLPLNKVISFGIVTGVLIGFLFLMDAGLEAGFAYQGEAFLKGYGHLLREHLGKGLLFVSLINFIPALLLTYLFFLLLHPPDQRAAFRVAKPAALLMLLLTAGYVGIKTVDIFGDGYHQVYRVVEIGVTWLLRVSGIFLGYALVNMKIEDKLSNRKYVR